TKDSRRRIELLLLARMHEFLRRPVDIEDINPDICEVLVKQWQREGVLVKSIRLRIEWFDRANAVAHALGLQKRFDFTNISLLRGYDWTTSRAGIPTPEAPTEVKRGRPVKRQMTLLATLTDHYQPERLTGRSANTTRLYKHSINAFSKYLCRPARVADLNTETVCKFLNFMLTETKLARATIQKDRTQLCTLWNWCAKKGWLTEFPQIASINCPDRIPDSWTDEEIKALMNACKLQQGMIGSIPACDFWLALLSVIHDSAERIGALLKTEASDLDSSGFLTVRGEHRKGSKRDKQYRLQPITVERLEAIRRPGQKRLFPWPYCYMYIFSLYGKVLESAGLPNNRRTKFHKIRRTTASNFEAAGGNATELLDHNNRSTTTKAYLNPSVLKTMMPADVLAGFGEDAAIAVQPEAMPEDADKLAQILAILNAPKS
ncbi:MAG TPA: hypothetical protein DDZ51_03040, partial [Planctomycetaceae bacterium]|nr:hypothetical protein [Planctomycetaceae bacterium]